MGVDACDSSSQLLQDFIAGSGGSGGGGGGRQNGSGSASTGMSARTIALSLLARLEASVSPPDTASSSSFQVGLLGPGLGERESASACPRSPSEHTY